MVHRVFLVLFFFLLQLGLSLRFSFTETPPPSLLQKLGLPVLPCEKQVVPEIFFMGGHESLGFSLASLRVALPYFFKGSTKEVSLRQLCFLAHFPKSFGALYLSGFTFAFEEQNLVLAEKMVLWGLENQREGVLFLHLWGFLSLLKGNLPDAFRAYKLLIEELKKFQIPPPWILQLVERLKAGQDPLLEKSLSRPICESLKQFFESKKAQKRFRDLCGAV